MATGDVADGERHREDRETEGERDTDEPDAEFREACGEHGASATAEDEPKRTDQLSEIRLRVHVFTFLFASSASGRPQPQAFSRLAEISCGNRMVNMTKPIPDSGGSAVEAAG
jgi:hypothetical protein